MTYSKSPQTEGRSGWSGFRRGRAHPRPGAWRPLEIAAMVLGFILFWPIGLAILGFKIWQRQTGYEGTLTTAVQQGWAFAENRCSSWNEGWSRTRDQVRGFAGFGSSGNSAFDDWRQAELARLEEEHRKLEAAEREFADFLRNLRRARDRDEFDRFMQARQQETRPGA